MKKKLIKYVCISYICEKIKNMKKYNYLILICTFFTLSACTGCQEESIIKEKETASEGFEDNSIIKSKMNVTLSSDVIHNQNIKIYTNTYKELNFIVENNKYSELTLNIPHGLMFDNLIENQQDLITLESKTLIVAENIIDTITIMTACIKPDYSMPNSDKWSIYNLIPEKLLVIEDVPSFFIKNDNKVRLIDSYRKKKIYATIEDQQNFIQIVIWLLLDTDKSTMENFMREYVYGGDAEKTENFINKYYEGASEIRDVYKDYKITGQVDVSKIITRYKKDVSKLKKDLLNKKDNLLKKIRR